jgi:ribosomal protein S21
LLETRTALRQPLRRFPLSVQVEVGEGQDIDQALCQLRKLVQEEYGRSWCKRRYGYHESKGVLGRKRKKMKKLRGGGPAYFQPGSLRLHIGYKELFERSGPGMAAGH